jgi:hypothetical protein
MRHDLAENWFQGIKISICERSSTFSAFRVGSMCFSKVVPAPGLSASSFLSSCSTSFVLLREKIAH